MSRQFRSDDTSKWADKFGNGSDGDLTISGNTTDAPIDSSCSGNSGDSSLSATNAAFAVGQLILIHQSRGTGVGNWELNKIRSYTAGTITTAYPLQNTYTDSGASQAQVLVMKQYNNVTINSGVTLTAKAWDGNVGGIIAFFTKGTLAITGSIAVSGSNAQGGSGQISPSNGGGFRGGWSQDSVNSTGLQGESATGTGSQSNAANGSGGGAGGGNASYNVGGGGGHSASGSAGTGSGSANGAGGGTVGAVDLTTMVFGGGGGGATGTAAASHHSGANGGGIAFLIAKNIVVSQSIVSNGGGWSSANYRIGGGGGAGGSILLKCQTATLGSNLVTATGGVTIASGGGENSGDGAAGRVHIDYRDSYTGTTNPTLDARQDLSLNDRRGGSFLLNMI